MNTLNIMLSNLSGKVIPLGYEGENLYTRVRINCIEVFSEYPNATVSMVVSPPVGDMYPALVEKSGVMVVWNITDSVLSSSGQGQAQITFTEDEVIRKSVVFGISINSSLVAEGEAPSPIQDWIDNAEATAKEIAEEAAADVIEGYAQLVEDVADMKETVDDLAEVVPNLETDVADLKTAKAPSIFESASGSIASFSDGADGMNLKALSVSVDPVQDLHGYDNPWPAGGSANLFSSEFEQGTISSQGGAESSSNVRIRSGYSEVEAETAYVASFGGSASNYYAHYYDSGKTYIGNSGGWINSGSSITTIASTKYIRFVLAKADTGADITPSDVNSFMLNSGSTALPYVPYANICPITGHSSVTVTRTGKNLLDVNTFRAGNMSTVGIWPNNNVATDGYIAINPGSYVWSIPPLSFPSGGGRYINIFDNDKNMIFNQSIYTTNDYVFTVPANGRYIRYMIYRAGTQFASLNDVLALHTQIEAGSSSSTYEPYQGVSVTIPLGQTVYGGTLDAVAGKLTVDRAMVTFDGTQTGLGFASGTTANRIAWNNFANVGRPGNVSKPFISDKLATSSNASSIKSDPWLIYNAVTDPRMFISVPKTIESATDFNTYCTSNPISVIYELATPTVITGLDQATITALYAQNNIFADTGNVSVDYPADTKLYIDKKLAELQALILENI